MQEDWSWYIAGAALPELRPALLGALESQGVGYVTRWDVALSRLGEGEVSWMGSWGQTSSWAPELFVALSLALQPDGVVTRTPDGAAVAFDSPGMWGRATMRDRTKPHTNAQWAEAVLLLGGLEPWTGDGLD